MSKSLKEVLRIFGEILETLIMAMKDNSPNYCINCIYRLHVFENKLNANICKQKSVVTNHPVTGKDIVITKRYCEDIRGNCLERCPDFRQDNREPYG